MDLENVKFLINGKTFDKSFSRSRIRLGKILYIKEDDPSKDIQVSESEFKDSKRVAVSWITPSIWAVTLIDIYNLEHSEVEATQKLLEGYMPREEVLENLSYFASKLRLEHLYKSSEYDESSLRVVFAVTSRLDLINLLKSEEVSRQLFHNWEPVIVYHLLTCFDLLGQPEAWIPFDSWLSSDTHKATREKLISENNSELNKADFSKRLYQGYQGLFGVKNSFFRFISEVLPEENRKELFNSIKIHTNSMPPSIETISEDGSEADKEKFLFSLRNNYTHKAKVVHGFNTETMVGSQSKFKKVFAVRVQEFKEKKWSTYMTSNWPQTGLKHWNIL